MSKSKLIQGDCLEEMDKLIEECVKVDLTVTSPPYDNLRTYNGNNDLWNEDVWKGCIERLYKITKDGGVVVWVVGDATIKGSETGTSFKQSLYFKEVGFNLHDTMIYEKANISFPDSVRYYSSFEYMFIFSNGKPKTFNPIKIKNKLFGKPVTATMRGKNGIIKKDSGFINKKLRPEFSVIRNIWKYANGSQGVGKKHPAIFPEKLANDHIISWSNEGDIVFDPFMGSGTTGVAAKNLNRDFIGIELDKEYFKIAEDRINNA